MIDPPDSSNDGTPPDPAPPLAGRAWRHPSEVMETNRLMGFAAPLPEPGRIHRIRARTHRFPLGTALVSGSLGALTMLVVLTGTGVVQGFRSPLSTETDATGEAVPTIELTPNPTALQGVVAVEVSDGAVTSRFGGIVVDGSGNIITTIDPASAGPVTVSQASGETTIARIGSSDPQTGLTLIHVDASVDLAPASIGTVDVGQSVAMFRPGVDPSTESVDGPFQARVTSANAATQLDGLERIGLAVVTSSPCLDAAQVVVDQDDHRVLALAMRGDDNPDDEMAYAIPAEVAVRVGRQLATSGRAHHGSLDVTFQKSTGSWPVTTTSDVVPNAQQSTPTSPVGGSQGSVATAELVVGSTSTGRDERDGTGERLQVGDELIAVDGAPVHSERDVAGRLLGIEPGATVPVTVRRGTQRLTLRTIVSGQLTAASSTTLQ